MFGSDQLPEQLHRIPIHDHPINTNTRMKPFTTPFAFLVLSSLSAQVNIQYSALSTFGVQADMHQMTAPAALPTLSDGNNQTWDLSGVTLQNVGTLNFNTSAGTPYASIYPSANWVWAQNVTGIGTSYTYLTISSSGIDMVARNVPFHTLDYSDPTGVIRFPMAYGETFSDPYVSTSGSDTVSWTYSGYGTVLTPLGTYTNVAKLVSNEGDLLLWNTNPLYPILIDDGDNTLFFIQTNVGIAEQGNTAMRTYPDPCHDRITVVDVAAGSTWRIVDGQGRQVSTGSINLVADQQIEVGSLAAGRYVLVVNNGTSVRHSSFVKE